MTTVVIVIHLMVVLAMIGLVLLQRSEGGALGIGGGQGALLSGRGAGNVLTKSTALLAAVFFATSLGLALISKYQSRPGDILERIPGQTAPVTTNAPEPPTPAGGAPATADELLKQLNTPAAGGPQTPPATGGATAPATPAPAPAAPAQAPAAQGTETPPAAQPAPTTGGGTGTGQ